MAITNAPPVLNPIRIVSLMKLTSSLSRINHANRLNPATVRAVSEAIANQRPGSPSIMPPIVAPSSSDIAEVGPMANCREAPNTA